MKLRSLCQLRLSSYFLASIIGLGLSLMLSGCGGGSGGSGGSGGGNNTPTPAITSISPTSTAAGSSDLTLTVNGSGFESSSAVLVGGTKESTTYVSATQLKATVPAAQMASGAELAVSVLNGSIGSTNSPAINLEVDNPVPFLATVSPGAEPTGVASPVLTVTGAGFVPTTVIDVNGSARPTTYSSSTQVSVTLTTADVAAVSVLSVTAVNSTPGGGTTEPVFIAVEAPTPTPAITSVSPNSFVIGSPSSSIIVYGSNLTTSSVVLWNGTPLPTNWGYYNSGYSLIATIPDADLTKAGTATVTVSSPTATPALSNGLPVTITNPPAPTITSMYPSGGPINVAATVNIMGTGFTQNSTVSVNGQQVPSNYYGSTEISVTIPASALVLLGNQNITVSTPAPGGGTSAPLPYTTFLPIANNDIVYNAADGLLYASIPVTSDGVAGGSVAGIDPNTGNVMRQIWVGSNPNKLALSTDGTQLFVGLDGAAAVAQVNLTTGAVVNQFSLGNGGQAYNAPFTAFSLAAVPGSPNSVAVSTSGASYQGGGVIIFDSGVPRPNTSTSVGPGQLAFGSSASTLYMANGAVQQLTVDSTGITATTPLYTPSIYVYSLQYDNGNLYLSSGGVISASTGTLLGTFYVSANTAASGPIVSDSTLGRAFVAGSSYSGSSDVYGFDESSFNQIGYIPVNPVNGGSYPFAFEKIVRWGQTGVALNTTYSSSSFNNSGQIFIFQSPLVKNVSSTPADLSVSLSAPATATTGTAISWTATVKNSGPNPAAGASLAVTLDSSLIVNSITPSQGSCGSGTTFACDLGTLANGASATVTVKATPSNAGTLAGVASVSSSSYDPTFTNNQSTTSTTVTGDLYAAVPVLSSISPNFVQAGAADFTLTVNGSGFNDNSVVNLGSAALTTTYVNATQLTAAVTAAQVANYGWASITVSNSSPGGGASKVVPLTIYNLVNVPASGLLFDPFSQNLYASVPSTATTLTGNSVVTINPVTGAVGTPVAVGSQPTVMAETADGNYLYIDLVGSTSLAQFNLLQNALTQTIPLSSSSYSSNSVTALAAMPGTDSTVIVDFSGTNSILDINGATGTFRPDYANGNTPAFADASHLYVDSGNQLGRYSIDANGATEIDLTTLNGLSSFGSGFQLANNRIYGAGGGIANPTTTPPSQIAVLPSVNFYTSSLSTDGAAADADPSLQKEFLMAVNTAGTWEYGLSRYNLKTYLPEDTLVMPPSTASNVLNWTMLRWGQDGLALLSSGIEYGATNQTVVQLILLRGPFVVPQELQTSTAASLTSSSASTIAHGTGNTILTLTGSHFLPGVAVTWNGSYRTTTIVDATHVSVAIPASDLASAGTASLVATNPGASASSALQITIN